MPRKRLLCTLRTVEACSALSVLWLYYYRMAEAVRNDQVQVSGTGLMVETVATVEQVGCSYCT